MSKEVTTNQEQQVLIPMVVDKASLLDNGMMAGIKKSDIRKWTIGCHKVDVVLVPGTQEQYNDIMNTYYREFKAEDRDKRCVVSDGKGHLIRCPECNKCKECPLYLTREHYGTATFSDLENTNDEGETVPFDPESTHDYNDADRYERMLVDLVDHINEVAPEYADLLNLLMDGLSRREAAAELNIPKSTAIDRVAKLRKIVDEFLENLYY